MEYFSKAKPFLIANQNEMLAETNALFGPWDSIDAFKTWYSSKTSASIPNSCIIGVTQSDGTIKRYEYRKTSNNAESWVNVDDTLSTYYTKSQTYSKTEVDSLISKADGSSLFPLFLDKFKGKTIGIIGTSTSTYQGWLPSDVSGYSGISYAKYYPRGDVNSASKTWWYQVAVALGMNPSTDISNCSWSGSRVTGSSNSTTTAYAGCSNKRIADLALRLKGKAPDIIICCIGANDWSTEVSIGTWTPSDAIPSEGTISTFREAYALMLYKLHLIYPTSRVFCCTCLDDVKRDSTSGWPSNNDNGVSVYTWNASIEEIAKAMGCDVINTHECGLNYANMLSYTVDGGLHPNAAGHTLMARKVVAELFAKY